MTRTHRFIGLFAFALIAIAMPTIASAQWGGNGGYYPNGGYGNGGYYNRDLRATVENLKNGARNFERQVDRGRNSRYNDRNLRSLADDFTRATRDLRNAYGNGRNMNNSADEARRVLSIGSQIDRELAYSGGYGGYGDRYGNGNLQGEWSRLRYDLQTLASAYGGYNGGYNNRYPRTNRNGNWRNSIPFPLPF